MTCLLIFIFFIITFQIESPISLTNLYLFLSHFRFNPQLSEDIAMDEKNDQKLINMLWCAKAYVHANRNKVIEMINCLK